LLSSAHSPRLRRLRFGLPVSLSMFVAGCDGLIPSAVRHNDAPGLPSLLVPPRRRRGLSLQGVNRTGATPNPSPATSQEYVVAEAVECII